MVKLIKGVNDLATLRPDLAAQWHPTKNGDLTPEMFTCSSHDKMWWKCPKGHEWFATIKDRYRGFNCPICAGKHVLIGYNDLATLRPDLALQWHPIKNGDLTPQMVTLHSGQKVWWICAKGHAWRAVIADRSRGTGCPICASESQTSFPEQAIYYYLKQIDNTVENRKKINDKVEVDIWVPSKNIAIEYDGCRYHNGKKSKQKEQKKNEYLKDCGIRLIRVRESTDKSIKVCIKNNNIIFSTKNNYVHLTTVINTLIKMVYYDVQLTINLDRARNNILELYKQDCLNNSLVTTHPELAKQWHPTKNGTLTPEMFTKGSGEKAWWVCPLGHEWEAQINSRSKGSGCPVCSGNTVLAGYNDLATTHPELAKQWHPTKNGNKTPEMFSKGSSEKAWWICPLGHEWQAVIYSRVKGNRCPICAKHKVLNTFDNLTTPTTPPIIN